MIDYDKNKESLYLKYWDVNNLFGQAMSQKLKIKTNSQDDSHIVEKLKNHDVMMLLRSNFFYFNKYNPQMFF